MARKPQSPNQASSNRVALDVEKMVHLENIGLTFLGARASYEIGGALIGAIAAGITLLVDRFLGVPWLYLVGIASLSVMRLSAAVIYGLMIRFFWTHAELDKRIDEYTLVKDDRYTTAGTATAAACLTAAVIIVTHQSTPVWMERWDVVVPMVALVGAVTNDSILTFTPMWFYTVILRRYPERIRPEEMVPNQPSRRERRRRPR